LTLCSRALPVRGTEVSDIRGKSSLVVCSRFSI